MTIVQYLVCNESIIMANNLPISFAAAVLIRWLYTNM